MTSDAEQVRYECANCGAVFNTILPPEWLPPTCYECNERHPWEKTDAA